MNTETKHQEYKGFTIEKLWLCDKWGYIIRNNMNNEALITRIFPSPNSCKTFIRIFLKKELSK